MDKSTPDQMNVRLKESYPSEKRNLIVFALNQILMRLGWMFKAESVVIPAFIDIYTASGTIRGLLPPHSTDRAEPAAVSRRPACCTDAEKTGVLYSHRIRLYCSVVSVVPDVRFCELVGECHHCCFSGALYRALAHGRL